jgi:hypothetical protein
VTAATLGRAPLAPTVDTVIRTFIERMSRVPSDVFVPWLILQRRACDVAVPRPRMLYCQVLRDRSQEPNVFNMIEETSGKVLLSAQYIADREEYCVRGPPPATSEQSSSTGSDSVWYSDWKQRLGRMTPPFIVGALSRNVLCTDWNMWDSGLNPAAEGASFLPIPRRRCCGYVSYGVNIFGTHPRSLTCMFAHPPRQIWLFSLWPLRSLALAPFMCTVWFHFMFILSVSGIFPDSPEALDVALDVRLKNNSFDVRFVSFCCWT